MTQNIQNASSSSLTKLHNALMAKKVATKVFTEKQALEVQINEIRCEVESRQW